MASPHFNEFIDGQIEFFESKMKMKKEKLDKAKQKKNHPDPPVDAIVVPLVEKVVVLQTSAGYFRPRSDVGIPPTRLVAAGAQLTVLLFSGRWQWNKT